MKKIIFAAAIALLSAMAWALPSPGQIEDALAAQRFADARSMVREVLRDKPDSAKAHLMNAFLLVHVDHDSKAANAELQTAAGLDKHGDVKASPLYGRTVAAIDMQPPTFSQNRASTAAQPPHSSGDTGAAVAHVLFYFLIIVVCIWAGISIFQALRPRRTTVHFAGGNGIPGSPQPSTVDGLSGGSGATIYQYSNPSPAPVIVTPSNQGTSGLATAAAVAGGVVAGNVISDSLTARRRRQLEDDEEVAARRRRDADQSYFDNSPLPGFTPSPVSYEAERSSFSSGSDSSAWDSSSSSSSSSDFGSSSDSGSASWD